MINLLIGVTGSIASYKIADFIAQNRNEFACTVILSAGAKKFVTKELFNNIGATAVFDDSDFGEHGTLHVNVSKNQDMILIAPASANKLGEIANGLAPDLLTTMLLAAEANIPKFIAPAMNNKMYQNLAVKQNLAKLSAFGYVIISPQPDELLACGDHGIGALAKLPDIKQYLLDKGNN